MVWSIGKWNKQNECHFYKMAVGLDRFFFLLSIVSESTNERGQKHPQYGGTGENTPFAKQCR